LTEVNDKEMQEPYSKQIEPYNIATLFKELDENGYNNKEVMEKLEWKFISVLSDDLWHRLPISLNEEIIGNPDLYVEILCYLYKPENDEDMEKKEIDGLTDEQIKHRSNNAYNFLRAINKLPGADKEGIIDYDILKSWIDKVFEICEKMKRVYAGHYNVGQFISKSLPIDGIWPQESICKVLEDYKNTDIDSGFYISVVNSRGTTSRGMFEGGQQERDEAKVYSDYAKKINPKFQRAFKVLKELENSYKYDANRIDEEAEQDKMDF
jgi:hypothetical protein